VRHAMSPRELYEGVWEALPEGLQPSLADARLAFLLGSLGGSERVLDLGCGEGWFTQALREAGFAVVGADVAQEPLRRARRRDPELDLQLLDEQGPWPFADAQFDAVWAGETIEHVADTAAWLSELRRVLRPDGVLLLSTPTHDLLRRLALALLPGAFSAHFDPRSDHLRFYTRASLRALLTDFRFVKVEISGLGGVPGARACLLASARRARF
jgi:2-polyprenyl-6-hydroxyphenyl methylase/3-demethylubiquinone-9 3-methyltransferase